MLDGVAVSVLARVLRCWPWEAAGCAAGWREGSLAHPLPVAAEPAPVGSLCMGSLIWRAVGVDVARLCWPGQRKALHAFVLSEVETASENLQGHSTQI